MSTKSAISINVEQSTSNTDLTNVPETGDDANSVHSISTLNVENFDKPLPDAEDMKGASLQSGSIGGIGFADPMLESSRLLRKLSEAFGMSVSL